MDARAVAPLIEALKDADDDVVLSAFQALIKIGVPSIQPLIDYVKENGPYMYASSTLIEIGSPSVDPLIATLQDKDPIVRSWAIGTLNDIHDARAIDPLILMLADDDADVRNNAITAVEGYGPPGVDDLISALSNENPKIRFGAARALAFSRDPRAREPLAAALNDPVFEVWFEAAMTLSYYNDARAVEPLINAMQNADPNIRSRAAAGFVWTADPRAVDALVIALKDGDSEVRKEAARALGYQGDTRAIEPLLAVVKSGDLDEVQQAAVVSLLSYGESAVERLSAALDNDQGLKLVAETYGAFLGKRVEGTETILIKSLNQYGDANMATGCLNSGNSLLAGAGSKWAGEHGYTVQWVKDNTHTAPVQWGPNQ